MLYYFKMQLNSMQLWIPIIIFFFICFICFSPHLYMYVCFWEIQNYSTFGLIHDLWNRLIWQTTDRQLDQRSKQTLVSHRQKNKTKHSFLYFQVSECSHWAVRNCLDYVWSQCRHTSCVSFTQTKMAGLWTTNRNCDIMAPAYKGQSNIILTGYS